ncbi:MAG TPA: hypothetical protein VFK05_08960 [Polyangiaceae bacterium]|nr:hypothetical protein [Polyangiaceae bacterium]
MTVLQKILATIRPLPLPERLQLIERASLEAAIVRMCVRDGEDQYQRAESVFRKATAGTEAWLSSVVLPEFEIP